MTALALLLLPLLSLVLPTLGQTVIGNFETPSERAGDSGDTSTNEVYKVGDTLKITWTSNATAAISLAIWQTGADATDQNIGTLTYLPNSRKFSPRRV